MMMFSQEAGCRRALAGLAVALLLAGLAQGATITVSPDESIQAAIDAASPGDTILVESGIYRENLNFTKSNIILQGVDTGGGLPVVIRDGVGNVTISAEGIMLENLAITNAVDDMARVNDSLIASLAYTPSKPSIGEEIIFDASQSRYISDNIVEYRWDFGDGETAEGVSVAHNYSKGGMYAVKLEVRTDTNQTNVTSKDIWVNTPPVAIFSYGPTELVAGALITFNASKSYDPDGKIADYEWDFGDGDVVRGCTTVTHFYWRDSSFAVNLIATDDNGVKSLNTTQLIVRERAEVALAYVFGEDGYSPLGHSNLTQYNGSKVITFTVASGPDGRGATNESVRTVDSIAQEIDEKVEIASPDVRNLVVSLASNHSGDRRIDQICSIYDHLRKDWRYASDPRGMEYYRSASSTIKIGNVLGCSGVGDSDDFAILMSSLIENIGVSTRIILADGPSGGHAYTEVYLGKMNTEDHRVERTLDWIRNEYNVSEVQVHIDMKTDDVWLNLDWGDDPRKGSYPGGPFYTAEKHVVLQVRDEYDKPPVNPPMHLKAAIRMGLSQATSGTLGMERLQRVVRSNTPIQRVALSL